METRTIEFRCGCTYETTLREGETMPEVRQRQLSARTQRTLPAMTSSHRLRSERPLSAEGYAERR